jgi:acyl-CoA thioesterase FadM
MLNDKVVKAIAAVAVPTAIAFATFDVRYLLSLGWMTVVGSRKRLRVPQNERKKRTTEILAGVPVGYVSRVKTSDIDHYGHLSNSKYFKEGDFARTILMMEGGFFQASFELGVPFVVASVSMRFRKELPFGKPFTISSRIVGWDQFSLFVEQRFESQSAKTGKKDLNGLMFARLQLTKKGRMKAIFERLGVPETPESKLPPPDVTAWAISVLDANRRVKEASGDKELSATSVAGSEDRSSGIKPFPRSKL